MKSIALGLIAVLAPAFASADASRPVTASALTISVERGPASRQSPPETNGEGQPRLHPRWSVTLDASGRVIALEPVDAPPVPAIRAPLEAAIRGWRFQPGAIGGQPTETKTTLALDISLVEHGDQYAIRVDDARTGAGLPDKGMHGVYPKYPHDAIARRKAGMVVLRVDYDDGGHVVGVRLADGAPEADLSFVRSATESAKRWTFAPEIVGGHGLGGSSLVPICFANYLDHDPTTTESCAWNPPAAHAGLGDGAIVSMDPAARLETEVIGRTL